MSHPIIKVSAQGLHVREFRQKAGHLKPGDKFGLKMKKGKRWKFKSFRMFNMESRVCESCGPYDSVSFHNSKHHLHFDSHFGPSYILAESVLRQLENW